MNNYLTYWRLGSPVFDRASGAEIYWPERRMALRSRLSSYPGSPQSFMAITGGAESGKSTLLRWLHDHQLPRHNVVLTSVLHDQSNPWWLSERLCALVGLKSPTPARRNSDSNPTGTDGGKKILVRLLLERLDEARYFGRQMIILIDNADQLQCGKSWQELADLLNLQSLSDPVLRVVVSGRPKLIDNLRKHHALDTRLGCHLALAPLTIDEAEKYMGWAWQRVTAEPLPFDVESLHYLYTLSGGVLGRLAKLAEQSLIEAAHRQERQITIATVDGAKEFLVAGDLASAPTNILVPAQPPVHTQPLVCKQPPVRTQDSRQAKPYESDTNRVATSSLIHFLEKLIDLF